jgi:hypothetical protein
MSWLTDRQRHGGLDPVMVPEVGTLWLCGKHLIAPDPVAVLDDSGAGAVWCLNHEHELVDRYPGYVSWLRADERARWAPIHDLGVAPVEQMRSTVSGVIDDLGVHGAVVVHCAAGMGRAGTIAVLTLMTAGLSASEARRMVAESRPGAGPESGAQADLVENWSV